MKRSQMIDIIVSSLRKHDGEMMSDPDFERRLVDTMLTACEQEGMLPPFSFSAYYSNADANGYVWEPEE